METGKALKVIAEEETSVYRFPFTTLSTNLYKFSTGAFLCHQSLVGSAKSYQRLTSSVDKKRLPYWSKVDGWGLPGECHVPKENWTSFVSYPTKDRYFTPFAILIESLLTASTMTHVDRRVPIHLRCFVMPGIFFHSPTRVALPSGLSAPRAYDQFPIHVHLTKVSPG